MNYPIFDLPGNWNRPESWENIPEISSFELEGCGSFFLSHPTTCRLARQDNYLLLRMDATDPEPELAVMQTEYHGWYMDDSAEIYLQGEDGAIHQLLFNITGAKIYFKSLALGGELGSNVEIHGGRLLHGWCIYLKLPLETIGLSWQREIRCMVRRNAPREFLTHCIEWGVSDDETPAILLNPVPAIPSEETCRRAEAELNASFREWLGTFNHAGVLGRMMQLYAAGNDAVLRKLCDDIAGVTFGSIQEARQILSNCTTALYRIVRTPGRENRVDFGKNAGKIKRLNGINCGPQFSNQSNSDFTEKYRALKVPYARLHDAPLVNPGMKLVDTSQIFPLFHLDPAVESNYYFTQTDDYLGYIRESGSDLIYRLGVSIEHSKKKYFAVTPPDFGQFAEICAGIVRHYNAGWNNGFHWNIKYWEIWNEPDLVPQMWNSTLEEYHRLYVTVAKRLKAEFPDIKVGGPCLASLNAARMKRFLKFCRQNNADVDFITWHRYSCKPSECLNQARLVRLIADSCGFLKAELHLNEWHYFPESCDWISLRRDPVVRTRVLSSPDGFNGIDSAAFITTLLTKWQDTPLDMSNYYMTTGSWGLLDANGNIYDTYYALLAFAPFADMRNRVQTISSGATSILAATDDDGHGIILVSSLRENTAEIRLHLDNLPANAVITVKSVDAQQLREVPFVFSEGCLCLRKDAASAVFQIMID